MADAISWMDPNNLGSAMSGLVGIGIIIFIFVALLFGVGVLYMSGLLKRRKYKIFLWEPRANNWEITQAKGENLPGGKESELFYGPFQTQKVLAIPGNAVRPGNQVYGYSKDRTDIHWIDADAFTLNDTEMRAEPALDPGMKITTLNLLVEEADRFQEKEKWKEFIWPMTTIAVAVIFGLVVMLGLGWVSDSNNKIAASNQAVAVALMNTTQALHAQASTIPTNPGISAGYTGR